MGVAVIVGTEKGAAILRADDAREVWTVDALQLPGWIVTASTRDARGRFYVGVTSDVYGVTILTSEDLEAWEPVAEPPRYTPADRGNSEHNRIIRASDPQGRMQAEQRHVDQIWRLHAAGDVLYAGVSEAGLFRSVDRGASWEALHGLSDHPSREAWVPGFGGLCAHAVLVDGGNPDRLWVGISAAGLFRSDDGGESWTAKNAGIAPGDDGEPGAEPIEAYCVHGLAHVPADPDVIYRQDHRGMYLTRDGGDSWQSIEGGLPIGELSGGLRCAYGFPIAFDPGSGSAFAVPLTGDNFRYPPDGRLRVYRTRDLGASWAPNASGLPDDCYASVLRGALAVDELDPCGVYVGTTAGNVYVSRDGGETWMLLPVTLPKVLSVVAFEV